MSSLRLTRRARRALALTTAVAAGAAALLATPPAGAAPLTPSIAIKFGTDQPGRPGDTNGAVTGPIGYVRLHGRNYEKWFAHSESWERYNYLYSKDELAPWVDRVRTMAREKETYVVTNNHFRGQAIVNAAEMKEALGIEGKVPPQVKETYAGRFS